MTSYSSITAGLFAACAAVSAAACPTSEDLARGVIFSAQVQDRGGATEHVALYTRRAEDGRIATALHPQLTGDPWERFTHAGLLSAEIKRRSGAQHATGTFEESFLAALPPDANQRVTGTATWHEEGQSWTTDYVLEAGAWGEALLGECPYASYQITITERRTAPDGTTRASTSQAAYLPELSFFALPPARSQMGYHAARTPRFTERFTWPFRGLD